MWSSSDLNDTRRVKPTQDVLASSASQRWAALSVRGIDCPVDPRTLGIWGRFVGASVPTLRSRCRAIGVGAKQSLDFTRVLRALIRASENGWDPMLEFDVSDSRTVERLLDQGGLGEVRSLTRVMMIQEFLSAQRFVTNPLAIRCVANAISPPPRAELEKRARA